ncbi:chromodomain-helicase-DNA-binding protein 5-like isoform X2 [Sesamum indicum]|uniref:Chromodomain-helicase-DNA-binding protein 5-like isoform X2 n=1 Tax=Sesamum indicum TaxID=4182 RepID=A0A6I9TUQ7_SESIN|nr:chromodomain-helicase-DNA-binding protein 5-like isoform X2 [Sesamum indicum]
MARGGKIGNKRKTRNKVRLEKKGSDESDEDYKVDEDEEFDESEDDYCSSLAEDESEESLGELEEEEEEEEEWVEKKAKKVGKSRRGKGFQGRKKNGLVKPKSKKVAYSEEEEEDYDDDYLSGAKRRKKNKVSYKEEEDDYIEIFSRQEEDEFVNEKQRKKSRVSKTGICGDSCKENPRDKDKVSYREEREESEFDDSDDEDDEEFSPGEVLKRTRRKLGKRRVLKKKNRSNLFKEFRDENHNPRKKKMTTGWGWGRRRKPNVNSDSDFVSSGSSDYEYTISEEEREQIREATEFCSRLNPSLRSSSSLKMIKEEETLPSKTKRPGKKGKQKMIDMKIEVGKQVCGICLSEEGKRTVRGVLNCCSHYFCFACIMEWSKVESRCPLCKQRFATISRTARADDGQDLKDAVFPVPERDQVYQPSEEELRGYLDPYENVLCTECQQGGDDAFMLLCDLCDSPAHTYCVGLGREVPEGNWYCDGCRPTALASSNAQALNATSDHGGINNSSVGSSPVAAVRETFDLNEVYVPDTPLTQVTGHSQSPRPSLGVQATSPASGSGAFTLFERRRIQRQIHQLLNNRSRQSDRSDGMAPASGINLFGSLIGRDMVAATQTTVMPARTAPDNIHLQQRLPDYNMPSLYNREVFSPRLSSLRGDALRNQASTSSDHSFAGLSQNQFAGINAGISGGLGHQQLHPCGGPSNTGPDASTSAYQFREGYSTFKDIARTVTHTQF